MRILYNIVWRVEKQVYFARIYNSFSSKIYAYICVFQIIKDVHVVVLCSNIYLFCVAQDLRIDSFPFSVISALRWWNLTGRSVCREFTFRAIVLFLCYAYGIPAIKTEVLTQEVIAHAENPLTLTCVKNCKEYIVKFWGYVAI